jgi:hypothetical protein
MVSVMINRGFRAAVLLLSILVGGAAGQGDALRGTVKGRIVDRGTQRPIYGAYNVVLDHRLGDVADSSGNVTVKHVPVGVHQLQISMMGYESVIRTDVVVRTNRITTVDVELSQQVVAMAASMVLTAQRRS